LILGDQAFRHLRQRLEVALKQGLDEVASLVLGVAFRDVHHEGLNHQCPRPAVDDLRVDGEDGGVVLKDDKQRDQLAWWVSARGRPVPYNQHTTGMQCR
jgi:hypothetical protein